MSEFKKVSFKIKYVCVCPVSNENLHPFFCFNVGLCGQEVSGSSWLW